MQTETKVTNKINGVDVATLYATVEQVKINNELAELSFNVKNKWIDGAHNRSTINTFHHANQQHEHDQKFIIDSDQSALLFGNDNGPNPLEYLLKAIASCMTTTIVFQASARNIKIEEIETTISGNINMLVFHGLKEEGRRGFENITMDYKIKADVSDEEFKELCELGPTYSPVFDSITNGVPVQFNIERK